MRNLEPPYQALNARLCTNRDDVWSAQVYPKTFVAWLKSNQHYPMLFCPRGQRGEKHLIPSKDTVFDFEAYQETIEKEGFTCRLGYGDDFLDTVGFHYSSKGKSVDLDFALYDQKHLLIVLEIADFFEAVICSMGMVIDANYKKTFLANQGHHIVWNTPPYGNQPLLAQQMSMLLQHGLLWAYNNTWAFCDRSHLAQWKGDRYGEDADYCQTINEYIIDYFGTPEQDKYFFELEGYPRFKFYNEHIEMTEYSHFYRLDTTTWGILLTLPGRSTEAYLDRSVLKEEASDKVLSIGPKGAAMFPVWMSGEDLLHYPPGLHRYTPYQKAHDLLVLDVPAGDYRQYYLYTLDEHGEQQDVGFLMRRE